MNTFGTVYMSTVGCGIVYGCLSDNPKPPVEPTTPTETTEPTTTAEPTTAPTETTTTAVDPTEDTTKSTTTTGVDPTETTKSTTTIKDEPSETIPPYTGDDILLGDVDLDGDVASTDLIVLAKYLANNKIYTLGKGDAETAAKAMVQADVNCDETINVIDSSKLVEYLIAGIDFK